MSKGFMLNQFDVSRLGKEAILFSGKKMTIIGNVIQIKSEFFYSRRKVVVVTEETSLDVYYPEIKRVLDHSGIVIAERLNRRSALRSTGKGKSKQLRKIDEKFVQDLANLTR